MAVRSRRVVEPELLHPEERGEVVEPEAVEAEYEIVNRPRCLPGRVAFPSLDRVRWVGVGLCAAWSGHGIVAAVQGAYCLGVGMGCFFLAAGVVLARDEVWTWPKR